jgi:hypothetical protein
VSKTGAPVNDVLRRSRANWPASQSTRLIDDHRRPQPDFRGPAWVEGLGPFDFVVTNQAVHELRHKDHAATLHAQVRPLLAPGGRYLVCDHFLGEGGLSNDQLYMTVAGQRDAPLRGGFASVDEVMVKGGLALHRAH